MKKLKISKNGDWSHWPTILFGSKLRIETNPNNADGKNDRQLCVMVEGSPRISSNGDKLHPIYTQEDLNNAIIMTQAGKMYNLLWEIIKGASLSKIRDETKQIIKNIHRD